MTVASAQTLRAITPLIITPFVEKTIIHGMSYGVTAAGYDIRVRQGAVLHMGRTYLLDSLEEFDVPNYLQGRVCDKSTLLRRGVSVGNSVLEPGWRGVLRLELQYAPLGLSYGEESSDYNGIPVDKHLPLTYENTVFTIMPGSPIAQVIFHFLDEQTDTPYGKGKYQDQKPGTDAVLERNK